ncbi:cellulose synthase subunit BcsC-related outer membrane protein [Peristeroidobacter agariperforans]|uniref:cellulose synthase subunit BcsC-related outer membrane protein n=1 Tax=Peristeroidobacter agariperforans TaxID=268404 RepID=UPI0018E59AF5|nr:cellulose synthase subunit BcsC-related outer membrane protein [Peristeroidobacter agariperforans]
MHNARVWETRDRGDLARLALEKLASARPDSPEVLLELGELNLRLSDIRAAEHVLERLNRRFPASAFATTFAIEYRFATRDRLQLASVARLIQTGHGEEARRQLDQLFPNGAPGGMLSTEYYRLLAGTPSGWTPAYHGLKALAETHRDDPRYQLALAKLLLYHEGTAGQASEILSALARRDDVRVADIDALLASSMQKPGNRVPPRVLREYLERHPSDAAVRELLRAQEFASEEAELLASGRLARIDIDGQKRNLQRLNTSLTALPDSNALAAEGKALTQLLAGQFPKWTPMQNEALAAAWMIRSREAQGAGQLELAAVQLHAAVALRSGEYEAVIPLASRMESLSDPALSGELLMAASRLQPGSDWLFETSVRWLANNDRAAEALSLLSSRAASSARSTRSGDELWALALARRAQAREAEGHPKEAISDLERAIVLAPRDPWNRYRLARLHAQQGSAEQSRAVLDEGVRLAASDPEMRYVQGLYLASIDDYEGAVAAIENIAANDRSEAINQLHARAQIEVASASARRLKSAGDADGARATLVAVEPLARVSADRMRQVAFAWIEIGDSRRAIDLATHHSACDAREGLAWSPQELLVCAEVFDRADDTERLSAALERLQTRQLTEEQRASTVHLQGSLDLLRVRTLQRERNLESAQRLLDEALQRAPADRRLRIARAELDLADSQPHAARDRLTVLTSEQPEDLNTRLTLVRALAESGQTALARQQLEAVQTQAHADDVDLQLRITRWQLASGDVAAADRTVQAVLATAPQRADALLLAGRVAQDERRYVAARDYYTQALRTGDESTATQAKLAQVDIDVRLQSWVEAAFEARHKPGEPGISRFDSTAVPAAWAHTMDDGRRFALRMDAIDIDAGELSSSFDTAALLGTIQAAGPQAQRAFVNEAQKGLSFGVEYLSDTLHADFGSTPRGFLLPNLVGGVEWTPDWGSLDLGLGFARRAVTSSVLSFGGLRDPISGVEWGGVVATGPFARIGLFRERYGFSGTLAVAELTGTRVPDNRFFKMRASADWKFLSGEETRAFIGTTINYWSYDRNLQNHTFGNGGYYSPQSYLSLTAPIEVQGISGRWSYRVRAAVSYTLSRVDEAAFYPDDPELQSRAAASPLPSGFDSPNFPNSRGSGLSLSGYAAVEWQISRAMVVGAKLDIDRADFYEPTTYMIYLRHIIGSPGPPLAEPPRPVTLFSDY